MRTFVAAGAINSFLAIALGAFGAHGLRSHLSAVLFAVYQTAVRYHMAHALALVLVGLLCERMPGSRLIPLGGWLLLAGIVLFSGSLYVLALTGVATLGAITPLGGLCFLAGWAVIAAGVLAPGAPRKAA